MSSKEYADLIKEELKRLGYSNLPEAVLREFVQKLLIEKQGEFDDEVTPTLPTTLHDNDSNDGGEDEVEDDHYKNEERKKYGRKPLGEVSTKNIQNAIVIPSLPISDIKNAAQSEMKQQQQQQQRHRASAAATTTRPTTKMTTVSLSQHWDEENDVSFQHLAEGKDYHHHRPATSRSATGSCSGVIWSNNSRALATAGTKKTDPVSRFANQKEMWKTDKFLNPHRRPQSATATSRVDLYDSRNNLKKCGVVQRPTTAHGQNSTTSIASSKKYVVPTEKRRDDLRAQIHQQMRMTTHTPPEKTPIVPNDYVVPTMQRRDALRWEVRAKMASANAE